MSTSIWKYLVIQFLTHDFRNLTETHGVLFWQNGGSMAGDVCFDAHWKAYYCNMKEVCSTTTTYFDSLLSWEKFASISKSCSSILNVFMLTEILLPLCL